MILSTSLLDNIRSGSNTSELFSEFKKTCRSLDTDDEEFEFFELFLCAATEHNHSELVKHLVTHIKRNRLDYIRRPLFLAIKSGNLPLVEIILGSNASMKLLERRGPRVREVNRPTDDRDRLSVIQYACVCDKREVLKLLVAYDRDQKRPPCVMNQPGEPESHSDCGHNTALHAVIQLLNEYHFSTMSDHFRLRSSLAAIVQIIVDAKVDVNALYRNEFTALTLLINEVNRMETRRVDITSNECEMIVETARVLLAAGSVTTGPKCDSLLDLLFQQIFCISHSFIFSYAGLRVNYFRMLSELVMIFLEHEAMFMQSRKYLLDKILSFTARCVMKFNGTADAGKEQMCRIFIDTMANTFSYVVLSHTDGMSSYLASDDHVGENHDRSCRYSVRLCDYSYDNILWLEFAIYFVWIAGYSSEPGESGKFVRKLLNYASASQISQLLKRLEDPTDTHAMVTRGIYQEYRKIALRLVREAKEEFTLQHLALRKITSAMSYRCLGVVDWSPLLIPKAVQEHIQAYIELK